MISRSTLSLAVLLLLASTAVLAQQKTCKALVLEGGGDLGAYQAGVIKGLVDAHTALGSLEELNYDVYTGTAWWGC